MKDEKYLFELGKRIQKIRKAKGMSVRQLGAICGLDYSNLSRMEGGQKDSHISTLKLISEKLKVDVKEFI